MNKAAFELELKHALYGFGYTLYKSKSGYWCKRGQHKYMIVRSAFPISDAEVRFNLSLEDVIEWTNFLYSR